MIALRRFFILAFYAVCIAWCATIGFGVLGLLAAKALGLTGIMSFLATSVAGCVGLQQAIKIIREM